MALSIQFFRANFRIRKFVIIHKRSIFAQRIDDGGSEEFKPLEFYPTQQRQSKGKKRFEDAQILPPRETRMPIDQDWPSVWPTAKTFHPARVPLPIYQGYDQKRAPPGKYANTELIKIPNFLHLTPSAIKRHCAAIKKFCTEFPKGLKTDIDCEKHFPIEIITTDFCHSSPTIRDERSRVVTMKFKMSSLDLDYHAEDKLRRLVSNHASFYKNTGTVVLMADRCPLRKQNYDYLYYLLTALHHEAWITEPWEHEKTEADMEKFFFQGSRIQDKFVKTVKQIKSNSGTNVSEKDVKDSNEVGAFEEAVTQLLNDGENQSTMQNYKASVLKALNLSS